MESTDKLSQARNEVYQRIGRNLLFFQQVEFILKYLLSRGRFSCSADQVQNVIRKWDRNTMGAMVEPFVETVFEPFDFSAVEPDAGKVSFSHAFTVEITPDQRAIFKRTLEALVDERNELAHHAITRFPMTSVEECAIACETLQKQREQFVAFRDQIQEWAKSMHQFHLSLKEQLESGGAFREEIHKHFSSK